MLQGEPNTIPDPHPPPCPSTIEQSPPFFIYSVPRRLKLFLRTQRAVGRVRGCCSKPHGSCLALRPAYSKHRHCCLPSARRPFLDCISPPPPSAASCSVCSKARWLDWWMTERAEPGSDASCPTCMSGQDKKCIRGPYTSFKTKWLGLLINQNALTASTKGLTCLHHTKLKTKAAMGSH